MKKSEKILKKYGFNPLVTTQDGLNKVNIKKTIEQNKEELEYLYNLNKK